MSGTASNYDVKKLINGQVIAALALVIAAVVAGPFVAGHFKASLPFIVICLSYGVMMFASSYVEEEQHFWYWTSTAWLFILTVKKYDSTPPLKSKLTTYSIRRQSCELGLLTVTSTLILVATRIARRWNQTGQKFAGDPDIARTFFSQHRLTLWTLVGATYFWNFQSLSSKGFSRFPPIFSDAISMTLTFVAITFKLAFTNEDSPELLAGLAKTIKKITAEIPLVFQARLVFIGIAGCLVYTILSSFALPSKRPNGKHFHIPWTSLSPSFSSSLIKLQLPCARSTTL